MCKFNLAPLCLLAACLMVCPAATAADDPANGVVDYLRDVKPLLAKHCYACHGALKQKSGLRLDTAALIQAGGESGPAIEPGKSADSLLIDAVTREADRMPLEGDPLSEVEVALLKRWIDQGAKAPTEAPPPDPRKHWSFQPPVRPNVPTVADASLAGHPVDAFLEAEREKHGLHPRPAAAKAVLLRRVYLDLIGLPPTREQLHAFLADERTDAYEKVVDELLASPHYGERWGRHWMDVWRYSDWSGFGKEVRDSQQHIWRWRDWIIQSLNADKSYARMVEEMLAGDELAPDDPHALAATGYLARNWYRFNRNVWLDNTVEHTAKAFLGVTLNCARCHDHKFDPVEQVDYYRFRAFFEPYDVRTDRVPGQADTTKDGVPRVYDAKADSPTYLFVRGNEAQPDKDHPLTPGLPEALGGANFEIRAVPLPPTTYDPGLQPFIQQESLSAARAEIGQAQAALAKAHTEAAAAHTQLAAIASGKGAAAGNAILGESGKPTSGENSKPGGEAKKQGPPLTYERAKALLERADAAVATAEKHLAAGQANLASIEARIAADRARFTTPPTADAQALALVAGKAHLAAEVARAEEAFANANQASVTANTSTPEEAAKDKPQIAHDVVLAEARKKLEAARAAAAKPTAEYPPLEKTYPATSTGRRLALARWIADRKNPLTARVAVNHIWLRHFGQPLVSTVFDFGVAGKPPSHPELLDWLAVEFMEKGWSMKALHRLLVASRAYCMQSSSDAVDANRTADANRAIDPDNVYLWRANSRRMEAEIVRDSVLYVAGQLDLAVGGPDVEHQQGLTVPRRSIYFQHANEKQMTFLKLFDAASVNECYRRSESIAPQQALALVNSSLALAQSRLLAGKLWKEVEGAPPVATAAADSNRDRAPVDRAPVDRAHLDGAFVRLAFEQVLCRDAADAERDACLGFLAAQTRQLTHPAGLTSFDSGDKNPVPPAADPHQRARENLIHVLLNHNDFVTIR